MIAYKQAKTEKEVHEILALQQLNLPKNLTETEIEEEGFLTVEHDFDLLKKMNDACPHTLAIAEERVVGYALSMHPKFATEIEVLKPMFTEINTVILTSADYIIMGQICVAKAFRGQGVFRGLYRNMQQFLSPHFSRIITEVDTKNTRSMRAHAALGFKELKRYAADGKEWSLIVLEYQPGD
ncbi:MAG: GNAT family N-acetyltransferase [Allomuricauda sp.]|nr:MAG: GNAT family N-acetyltransferase [Allomuricauda sp.]